MKPTSALEKVTPTQAATWLGDPKINHSNRTLRQDHVRFLAKEMIDGRWEPNNDAICFGKDGRLLNGQHRLHAIVLSGKPQEVFITRGLSDDAFKVMDAGLKRANHERIHLVNDFTQNHLICQAIRNFLYETGPRSNKISVGEIEDEYLKKADAWTWLGAEAVGMHARLKKAGIMAALGIYRYVKPEKAAVFLDGYRSGAGLSQDSPMLRLRNMAMTGDHQDCNYWRVVSLMRAHLQGRTISTIYPATEDMMGHENSVKLTQERTERAKKAAETRKKKQQNPSQGGDHAA